MSTGGAVLLTRVSNRTIHLDAPLWPPSWPMGLTMLRLLLLPVFLWLLLTDANTEGRDRRHLAVAVFALMAITDKLDGYLARRLNQTSKLGALLDPIADKVLIACSVLLLGFEWIAPRGFRIPWTVVAILYAKDILLAVGSLALLRMTGTVTIRPRFLGRAGTVLQLALVIATLIGPDAARLSEPLAYYLTRGLWWAVSAFAIGASVAYVFQGIKQLRDSRLNHALQPNP
jgi:cardiolipin synthase